MAEPIPEPPAPNASGATAGPTSSPSPSGSEQPAAAGPIRFAVDLFDLEESNIAPGDGTRLTAIGGTPAEGGAPGTARDEWWIPIALVALALLLVEWLVYERDGARRIGGWLGGLGRRGPLRRRGTR